VRDLVKGRGVRDMEALPDANGVDANAQELLSSRVISGLDTHPTFLSYTELLGARPPRPPHYSRDASACAYRARPSRV
jgi:hypothetical protein